MVESSRTSGSSPPKAATELAKTRRGGRKQWRARSVADDKGGKAITTSIQAVREPRTSPELPLVIVIPRVKVKGGKHHTAQASEFASITGIGPTHRGQNLGSHRGPGAGIHGPTF